MEIVFRHVDGERFPHCCACGGVHEASGFEYHALWHHWDCKCKTEMMPSFHHDCGGVELARFSYDRRLTPQETNDVIDAHLKAHGHGKS